MPIYFHLTAKGAHNLPRIKETIFRRGANIKPFLRGLPDQGVIELAYHIESRFNRTAILGDKAVEEELRQLGVGLIHREGKDNTIKFTFGPLVTLNGIETETKRLAGAGERVRALLFVIQTLYSPGMPRDSVRQLEAELRTRYHLPIDIGVIVNGAASPAGLAATGNAAAENRLQIAGRIFNALVSVLNGGMGTRLFGTRKLKGDILFGFNNLAIWNILTALYFRSQMPLAHPQEWGEYHVSLANDGILVPFGRLVALGELLRHASPGKVKEGYLFVSPDDDKEVSEKDSQRFGMVAISAVDGSFICSTEKKGRKATLEQAQALLAARGRHVHGDQIRLYINYFGSATTRLVEEDLETALRMHVRPGTTIDQIGDVDKYSLLFAALSSSCAEDFRTAIKGSALERLLVEGEINVFYGRLLNVLYYCERRDDGSLVLNDKGLPKVLKDDKGNPLMRYGFAEFNRGAIAIDIGTLPSLYGLYLDMVRVFDNESLSRDALLQARRELESGGSLSPTETQAFNELELMARTQERIVRLTSQRIAGLDPKTTIEGCEFVLDPENPPRIGVDTDYYTMPPALEKSKDRPDIYMQLQDILGIRADESLWEYRIDDDGQPRTYGPTVPKANRFGHLLFLFDPEGIKTVKLARSRIKPNVVIGKNTLVLDSEVGSGTSKTVIAQGGAVVQSCVARSVTHKQVKHVSQLELHKRLLAAAEGGQESSVLIDLPNGWRATFTYVATDESTRLARQLAERREVLNTDEGRTVTNLRRVLGIGTKNRIVTLDKKNPDSIRLVNPANLDSVRTEDHYHFSVSFERVSQPPYIIYGWDKREQLEIDEPMAMIGKQPVANAPVQHYKVPFTADPAATRLAFQGGITMKDTAWQEDAGYFLRFKMRSNAELITPSADEPQRDLPGEMAKAIEFAIQQLPFVYNLPRTGPAGLPTLDREAMKRRINAACADEAGNVREAIMQELIRQTPRILSAPLAQITGIARADLEASLQEMQNGQEHPIEDLLNLGVNPAQRQQIRQLLAGFPLSEVIFTEYGLPLESFTPVIEAIIEQFRYQPVPIFEEKIESRPGVRTVINYQPKGVLPPLPQDIIDDIDLTTLPD